MICRVMALPQVRDAFNFTQAEFEALWDSVGDHLLIEVYNNSSRPQGNAVVKVTQKYRADRDGAFFLCQYLGCSDSYYAYWVANDMERDPYHHLCRHSIRTCRGKVGRDQIVHVLRWNSISQKEATLILKSWGVPERAPLKRKPRPVEEHPKTASKSKPGPPLRHPSRSPGRSPRRSSGADRVEDSKGEPGRKRKPEAKKEKEPSSDYEHTYESEEEEVVPKDKSKKASGKVHPSVEAEGAGRRQHRRQHHHGSGASKRKSALAAKSEKAMRKGASALDAVIDEDDAMLDPDSEVVRKAEERLPALREDLKSRRDAKSSRSTPGEILAARASSVKVEKKRKSRDKEESLVRLLKSAGSRKRSRSESSDEPSDSSGEISKLTGGKSDFAKKQRRLKELSARRPGVLMSRGFALMHEQLGAIFDGEGRREEEASILSPVATRYLLSVVVPHMGEDLIGSEKMRELRTAAHCLDLLVQGKAAQAGDLMTQRLKALLMTLRDKSDLASRYLELIAFETFPGATTSTEADYARNLAVKAAKSEELLKRAVV